VYDAYLEAEQESYRIEQYGIYEQEQYERDLENGDLACAAPWASDEDPYDFEVAQGGDDPEAIEPVLETEADLGPAEEAPSTPLAATFSEAASGVESQAADPSSGGPSRACSSSGTRILSGRHQSCGRSSSGSSGLSYFPEKSSFLAFFSW
jgi:hypothetical protein